MRHFLLIPFLLVFLHSDLLAQDTTNAPVHITTIPDNGILLNKGWKFHAGDNTEWAKTDFDDNAWQSINPTLDIYDLPQVQKAPSSWLRLHLQLDTTLVSRPIAMVINQIGASEVYLNGELVNRFGQVSNNAADLKTLNPNNKPFTFQFHGNIKQVIAIRYAFQTRVPYVRSIISGNLYFRLKLQEPNKALENYIYPLITTILSSVFQFGIYLLLCVIHLFFYLSYPARKVNLYFAIYTFGESMTFWGGPNNPFSHQSVGLLLVQVLFIIGASTANGFKLISIFKLLNQPVGKVAKSVLTLCLLGIPFGLWPYQWGGISAIVTFILVGITTIWISMGAVKRKQPGARIVLVGQVVSLLAFISFAFIGTTYLTKSNFSFSIFVLYEVLFTLAFLCPPLFISLLLAREFAQTNRSLIHQLREVENLSQEKQQILAAQKETLERQVTERTAELQHSLKELKETQGQLLQKEKMASLGELTAGIAHEIQNPLNFINNFSEVNTELIYELQDELKTGNTDEALIISNDIKENEQKINLHGKRADAIVKGMLQHSRASTGQKEPTDINALADEYLRLSYHGLRAKDKDFNATIETNFDESIGKADFVPQDIGRVLLNLFNNAFYAANEKKKGMNGGFEPAVSVSTKKEKDKVNIVIRDNGNGIPQKNIDKIFQPFFTTKPTGEGTGLGLSLSYDIIKAHGGELKVNSIEGEGAEFSIELPA